MACSWDSIQNYDVLKVSTVSFCRYREGRYPENMETLTISNTCSMETKVAFCFQYDHNATTWLLDPPAMTLQPGESKVGGAVGGAKLGVGLNECIGMMIRIAFSIFTASFPPPRT